MTPLNTDRILSDINLALGGKGPLRCPGCHGATFVVVPKTLRVQTAYLHEDAEIVELVLLVCKDCSCAMTYVFQDRWAEGYLGDEEREQVEVTKQAVKEAMTEEREIWDEDDEPPADLDDEPEVVRSDLESMLSEISRPMKAKKPPQRHKKSRKLSSVPDVGITDHERAQIEEARRRAEVEDESVFEDDV